MPHSDWREPAARPRARLATATGAQHELAGHLGIALPTDKPALLAAAILRDALGAIIDAPPKPASTEQLEYVDDLSAWSTPADPQPSTRAIVFRYMLIREAADPALSTRQRGKLVRAIAAREQPCSGSLAVSPCPMAGSQLPR